jgi:ribosome-binding ATPase YchF (GTP1/OBG family)
MAFKKGTSGNPDGRRKGAANKVTTELRERIKDFLEGQWDKIERDFNTLEAKDRVALFERLLQYILPRMSSVDLDADIDMKLLSEEALDGLAERILTKNKSNDNE